MGVQVYGCFSDWNSFGNVSRAIALALKRRNVPTSIYEIGTMSPTYRDVSCNVALNSDEPVGVYIGYPEAGVGWLRGHEHRILVTVCEADPIPREWVWACNEATLVAVPSRFCASAFTDAGVKNVMVARHGVWPELLGPQARTPGTGLTLLHMSGALSFPQRKGTPQLFLAVKKLIKDFTQLRLLLKMPQTVAIEAALKAAGIHRHVEFLPFRAYAPWEMRQLLAQVDAVVQPSRGEGFGLVPLEARCVGVPAILTPATGHLEHFVQGVDVEVGVGLPGVLPTQGNAQGRCPTVSPEAIEAAIRRFILHRGTYEMATRAWAKRRAEEWRWDRVLDPLVKHIRPLAVVREPVRSGAAASLRGTS